jgi:alpha-D-xyloside xylohydrolase
MQYTETHDFNTLPLLIRPEAVIPYNPSLETPEGDYMAGLKVLVNGPLEENAHVDIVLPSDVQGVHKTIFISKGLEAHETVPELVDLTRPRVSLK